MFARLLVALLTVVVSTPIYADCPVVKQESAHDCCHKTKDCPQPVPVKVQPCFDCVADVRSTAELTQQPAVVATAAILPVQSPIHPIEQPAANPTGPLNDSSSTYLRNGVLRL